MPTTDPLAQAAIEPIEPGMIVGLGTGRAASRAVQALALRVATTGLRVTCVATSRATEALATSLGLRLIDPASVASIDYLFDGADEVDPQLRMIKGGGGAMTRERIIARMAPADAARRVYLIDAGKRTPVLGARAKLPIEVLPLARSIAARELEGLDLEGAYRLLPAQPGASAEFVTDNGALVLDAALPAALVTRAPGALAELDARIRAVPGVIDHGLFLAECGTLLVEEAQGSASISRQCR
jgi:ribose 5-phosphate isomerase A